MPYPFQFCMDGFDFILGDVIKYLYSEPINLTCVRIQAHIVTLFLLSFRIVCKMICAVADLAYCVSSSISSSRACLIVAQTSVRFNALALDTSSTAFIDGKVPLA